jgi:hypothetical protein
MTSFSQSEKISNIYFNMGELLESVLNIGLPDIVIGIGIYLAGSKFIFNRVPDRKDDKSKADVIEANENSVASSYDVKLVGKSSSTGSGDPLYIQKLKSDIINRGGIPQVMYGSGNPKTDEAILETQLLSMASSMDTAAHKPADERPQDTNIDAVGFKVLAWKSFVDMKSGTITKKDGELE